LCVFISTCDKTVIYCWDHCAVAYMSTVLSLCNDVQAAEVKLEQVNFNAEFITRMIPRLEWSAVCSAAESVSFIICFLASAFSNYCTSACVCLVSVSKQWFLWENNNYCSIFVLQFCYLVEGKNHLLRYAAVDEITKIMVMYLSCSLGDRKGIWPVKLAAAIQKCSNVSMTSSRSWKSRFYKNEIVVVVVCTVIVCSDILLLISNNANFSWCVWSA